MPIKLTHHSCRQHQPFISTAAVSSSPPPTTLTTYIFNGSVSTLSARYFSVAAWDSVLLAYALLRGEWPMICQSTSSRTWAKKVAARREGGKHVLDLGLCGVGCHP